MTDTCVILAGGLGTRLRGVVDNIPKVMAPVNGRPFLEYQMEHLYRQGIRTFVLATGYKHEDVYNHFSLARRSYLKPVFSGMNIICSHETTPLGTGGAVLMAIHELDEPVFLLNGDSFFEVNLNDLWRTRKTRNADLVMALREVEDVSRYGAVSVNETGRIVQFKEKGAGTGPGLINGGVYLFDTGWLKKKAQFSRFSFELDVLAASVESDNLTGVVFNNYFIDIGVPTEYDKAQHDFKNR
jgi:D-glycero-alpha-D-manno-heptose 1-phosphate guanylyltransferase